MFSSNTSSAAGDANFVEDVFSTYLYAGNGATQTITNGIDLAGKGGLVWCKSRSAAGNNGLTDTARGTGNSSSTSGELSTDNTNAPGTSPGMRFSDVTSFTSSGFGLSYVTSTENESGVTYASWTFREQPKFFDVVTYTGNGAGSQTISHALGATPGCIIVKRTDAVSSWFVYHRGGQYGQNGYLLLNSTNAESNIGADVWTPTSTTFQANSTFINLNVSGGTYVAYLFAHNAGGFGLTGTDNVISCGSFTVSSGTGSTDVNLGYEPQWLLAKPSTDPGFATNWNLYDTMRGWVNTTTAGNVNKRLNPNLSQQETSDKSFQPTATGFTMLNSEVYPGTSITYIYIAIRRGPMKVPTDGTKVFLPTLYAGDGAATQTITGASFTPDLSLLFDRNRDGLTYTPWTDRLRGGRNFLESNNTNGETTNNANGVQTLNMNGVTIAAGNSWNNSTFVPDGLTYLFGRAPGFFDEVCYTGTGVARAVAHNLTVVPELIIVKRRDSTDIWPVWNPTIFNIDSGYITVLNSTVSVSNSGTSFNSTAPTSTVFSVGTNANTNASGGTYVSYLFATCPGVSKVGSYTGTGTTQQINCGFTGGARFVLIKRIASAGGAPAGADWYVWDSARGIVAGNDPYLLLNSTAAEVTSTDYVDTYSAGFEISSTAPAEINASGGSFIFFAVA